MSDSSQKLARQLRRQGFTVATTNGGHFRISHPLMSTVVYTGKTPSDHRARIALRAQLRRALRGRGN